MLNVASLSVRPGGRISVFRLSILSARRTEALSLTGGANLSQHRYTAGVLSPGSPRLSVGHAVRFVSLSTSYSKEAVDFSSSNGPDWENFGSLSNDIASRRSYKKSSSDIRDLKHQEDAAAEEENSEVGELNKTRRRRNTPYWYFLQCKKLIKENKVRHLSLGLPRFFHLISVCLTVFCFLTAAGGSGSVQQRHAEGGEAAA